MTDASSRARAGYFFEIITRERIFFLRADDENEMHMWMKSIADARTCVDEDPTKVRMSLTQTNYHYWPHCS